jgi:beta-lactamase regulating signal transducer with metallopeptidase domain
MTHWMHLGLSNAVVAALIALAAAVVTWRGRCRPALAYGLWLLVLVKLVTPPLVSVPLSWPQRDPEAEPVAEVSCPAMAGPVVAAEAPSGIELTPPETPADWRAMIAGAWLAGSLAFAALAAWRVARLARWLRGLAAAPAAWQERVARLAERIGLRRSPRVLVSPHGAVPPLVVGLAGRPVLVFPLGLWDRLGEAQRDAVLLHELAHLRRGDHRVRLLELAALTLYWWFPLAWWASRRLRQAEEECCDAWVTWAAPDARPAYAAALVETVAFLSGGPPSLPIGASGAGPVVALKRRLSMILRDETPRGLSRLGWAMMLGALALMPLMPTLGRGEPKPPAKAEPPLTMNGLLSMKSCVQCHAPLPAAKAFDSDLHGRVIRLMDALKKQREQAERTEKELRSALDRFEKSQEKPKKEGERERLDREVKELRDKVERLQRELEGKRGKEQKQEPNLPVHSTMYVNHKQIRLPFQYGRQGEAKKLSFFVRSGTEKKWTLFGSSKEKKGEFEYTAPEDGIYAFTVQIGGEEVDVPRPDERTLVTVVVDTVRPVITMKLRDRGKDSIEVEWTIEEDHPNLASLHAEYRLDYEKKWRPLSVAPGLRGSSAVRLEDRDKIEEVRVRMTDKAGNYSEAILKR